MIYFTNYTTNINWYRVLVL